MSKQLLLPLTLLLCLQSMASDRLRPFLAESETPAPAIIVCPGGSYCWHDMKAEGTEVARWLQANGISAFVLKYRVQGIMPYILHSRLLFRGHQYPDALNDLQQAISFVREHAAEYHINPSRIGVMGFSAGGHLALSSMENGQCSMVNGQWSMLFRCCHLSCGKHVAPLQP